MIPLRGSSASALLLLPATVLLFVFMVLPLCSMLWLSLSPNALVHFKGPGFGNYAYLLGKPYYLRVGLRTLRLALLCTGLSILLGLPAALAMRRESPEAVRGLTLAMTLPVLAGPLVVVLGWMVLLSDGGPLLQPLRALGLIGRVKLLGSETGIVIGVVHFVLPFVVLSLTSAVRAIPAELSEAARDLGASWWQEVLYLTLPLLAPGLVAATVVALSLSMSSFVAPHYLGGPADLTLTTLVSQFVLATYNGQLAATVSMILLVVMTALLALLTAGTARWVRRASA